MTPSSGSCVACGARFLGGVLACPRSASAVPRDAPVRRWSPGLCQPALVGRAALLGRLVSLAEDVRRGLGRAVWLTGEAGLGKTRLKDALVEILAAEGFEVWEGSGLALPGAPAGIFRELLEATRALSPPAGTGRVSSADAERITRFLEGRERQGVPASLVSERTALFDSLCHALMPHRRPRLLVLEDWQHGDPLSHALVEELVSRLSHTPLFLLALQRPGGTAPAPVTAEVLTVGRLGPSEAAELLEGRLRGRGMPPPSVREALLRGSAGHPLHLLHAVTLLEEQAGLAVPLTGEAAVAARQMLLPDAQREVLKAATVLGPSFPRAVLATLAGGHAPLALLEAGGWLRSVSGGRYTWAVEPASGLDEVPEAALPQAHRRAAEAYEALADPLRHRACMELTRQWLSAEDSARALPYLVALAGWHLSALEPGPALAVYRFALGLAETLAPDVSREWQRRLWEHMGDAHRLAGEDLEAESAWHTARKLDGEGLASALGERARRLFKLTSVVLAQGKHEEVLGLDREGRRDCLSAAPLMSVSMDALCALALAALGRFQEARARILLAREQFHFASGADDALARAGVEALLHRAMGGVQLGLGFPEAAAAEYAQVLRWSERAGDTWEHSTALLSLGDAYSRAGDRERAAHFFQLALELDSRTGDRRGMAYTHHGLALLHTRAGAPELAKEDALRGLQLASMLEDRRLQSLLRCVLGRAQLQLGELEEAGRQLQLAARDATAAGARVELLQAEACLRVLEARR
ncbi:Tetratricopeptide repeat protein [Myxococcus hansupus]|uniref:Tetratricopeptide repeat protein n=1 Tax=Pseudomyxococcus hansupus TaxID=1297742 RepID=A0A0H4WWN0_9BACT|nr:AAA family ATPase [Myxococcus hansupus]AKQ67219.1 Tetratricopeptide repeat protein [Myxococcus hansupus]